MYMKKPVCPEIHFGDKMVKVSVLAQRRGIYASKISRQLAEPKQPMTKGNVFLFVFVALSFLMIGAFIAAVITGKVLLVPVLGLVAFAFFYLALEERGRIRESKQDLDRREQMYRLADAKWWKLWICEEHGIVVDPETGKTCKPGELREFLYKLI